MNKQLNSISNGLLLKINYFPMGKKLFNDFKIK